MFAIFIMEQENKMKNIKMNMSNIKHNNSNSDRSDSNNEQGMGTTI